MKFLQYFLALAIVVPMVASGEDQQESSIGYPSVEAALAALKNDPSVTITPHEGWIIVTHEGDGQYVMWSFTPSNHAAHPAAIKREVIESNGSVSIVMNALCQSTKNECDKLIAEFEELNEKIRGSMQANS